MSCMSPYSMPLWTILTKWPAPFSPIQSQHGSPSGVLAQIANLIGEAGGNILEVIHNRMATDTSAKLADLGMTVEARDAEHAAEIRKVLKKAGFKLKA